MFNFNYRARISDPNGQDVCAILNPTGSGTRLLVKKIVVTTSSRSKIVLITRKDGQVNPEEVVLERVISPSDPENEEVCVAIPINRPDMPEPWDAGRYFSIPDSGINQIIGPADEFVIPEGYRVAVKVIPYEVGQSATIDINFKQK